jgi:hypothetical protein
MNRSKVESVKDIGDKVANRCKILHNRSLSTKHRTLRLWHVQGRYDKEITNLESYGRRLISITLETEESRNTQKLNVLLMHMKSEEVLQNIQVLRSILDSVELRILEKRVTHG